MSYRNQVVYQTNADYQATLERLEENPLIVDVTDKGIIWFRFINTETVFTLSPYGRLQVRWNNEEEKKVLLPLVKALLVPKKPPLKVKPLKQQLWIEYPPPKNFKLYWCKEETEYVQNKRLFLVTEEPIPIWLALAIKEKYPNIEIRTRKKSIWERFCEWLTKPSIPIEF